MINKFLMENESNSKDNLRTGTSFCRIRQAQQIWATIYRNSSEKTSFTGKTIFFKEPFAVV